MFENETFDYKQSLPNSRDDNGKGRLRRVCCAFANSQGGFIVFGISDDRSQSPEDRLLGVDSNLDFPQQFGNYPKTCNPSIEWNFLNPPLNLQSGNVLHIVEIPKSWKAPHATGDRETGWRFTKRTNQGDEGMTVDEVRQVFLGYYEKRLKLQLLRAELEALKAQASQAANVSQGQVSLISFDLQVIESILTDTYSITATEIGLHGSLSRVRQFCTMGNNQIRIILGVFHIPLTNKEELIRQHDEAIKSICYEIVTSCDFAIVHLDRFLTNQSSV
jgi:Putative DNA-binding domain